MGSDATEALLRLQTSHDSRTVRAWLDGARIETQPDGAIRLHVRGPFQKRCLENRCASDIEDAFGKGVTVVADQAPREAPRRRAVPRLTGPAGAFAHRMVRAFVESDNPAVRLIVLHGPAQSGKSLLVDWVAQRGGPRVFRLDLERLRAGRSRGLVPRKPLVIADGLEALASRATAQRTLCTIIDAVLDRGDRLLFAVEGHPANDETILPPLRSRLVGGVLVPLEREPSTAAPPPKREAEILGRMKDIAAGLFDVERDLLDGSTRRRIVVEARRTVIAAARRAGIAEKEIASAFGLRSQRAVREAERWAEREERRDRGYASLLHEVCRVLPKQ